MKLNSYSSKLCPFILLLFYTCLILGCAKPLVQKGKASYYSDKFNGRKTASGVVFRNSRKTAAHKTLSFGTKVKVVNLSNNKKVKVRINDRGPFVQGRIIDLSKKSARKIGMLRAGITEVELRYRLRK